MTSQLPPGDMEDDEQEDDGQEDEEQVRPVRERRVQKPKPVADVGPFERKMLDRLDRGALRDRIEYSVKAMFEDVQGARKDPAWGRYLAESGQDEIERYFAGGHPLVPESALTPIPKAKPKEKKATLGRISSVLKEEMLGPDGLGAGDEDEPEGAFQLGAWQTGLWKPDGERAKIEGPRNYTADYDILLANSISQTLINRLTDGGIEVTEVQAMILKDRVVVSANEKAAVKELVNTTVASILSQPPRGVQKALAAREQHLKTLGSVLKGKPSQGDEDRFVLMAASSSINPEQAPAMDAMAAILETENYVIDGGNNAGFLTNAKGADKIVLISDAGFCHAEQNLLVALAKSGYSGPVTVAGGKRPCTACHVALMLVMKYKYQHLRYVRRHGGGWFASSRSSFARLANALNVPMHAVKAMAKEVLTLDQFATAFEEDAPEEEEVTDLRSRVLSQKVATNMLPSLADPPEVVREAYKEYTPDPEEVEREKQFEADYQMGSGEEDDDPEELSDLAKDKQTPEEVEQLRQDLGSLPEQPGGMEVDEES